MMDPVDLIFQAEQNLVETIRTLMEPIQGEVRELVV